MARFYPNWQIDGTAALSVDESSFARPDAVIVPFPRDVRPSSHLDASSTPSSLNCTRECTPTAHVRQQRTSCCKIKAARRFDMPSARKSRITEHVLTSSFKRSASTARCTDDSRVRNGHASAFELFARARHGFSRVLDASELACSLRFEGAKGCAYGRFTRFQTVAAFGGFSLFGIAVILLSL